MGKNPHLPTRSAVCRFRDLSAKPMESIMKTAAQLREEIAAQFDRIQAILDVASDAKRELTTEEKSSIDAIQGVGKKGEAGHKPGVIDSLEADLARAELVEKRAADLAAKRTGGIPQASSGDPLDQRIGGGRIKLPAQVRVTRLQAFRGPDADLHAYTAGQFYMALIGKPAAKQWCREHGIMNATMIESTDSLGGVLVPETTSSMIIDLVEERGVFRRESNVVPMAGDTHNEPRVASGLTAYFVSEGSAITSSNLTFDSVKLVARTLAALVPISIQLSDDAIANVGDKVTQKIAYAFADKEDECGFNGTGSSTYGGVVGLISAIAAGSKYTAITGNTAFSTLDLDDFEAMVGKLKQYPGIRPKWYISQAGWANSMLRLAEAAGGNTVSQVQAGAEKMFLGFPVVITQVMNSTTSAQTSTDGICYFGDLRMATSMGVNGGVRVDVDRSYGFNQALIYIRGMERFDIVCHEIGTASVSGAVVMMSTPSS
jgi:HK97 family phage major capsid protein